MANYDASIRINTGISPDKFCDCEINTESIKRFKESISRMEKIITETFNTQTTKQTFEMFGRFMKDNFLRISPVFKQNNFEEMERFLQLSFDEMSDAMGLKNIEALQNIDFSKIFRNSSYREQYDEVSKTAYEYVEEEVKYEENISQEELLEVFNEQIEDKVGWQEKLYNKSEEFQRKYYVFYNVVIGFLKLLVATVVTSFLELGIAYVRGNLTSEPNKDAPAIYYFDQRTEIYIIGETDNYYFITYTDDDGNEVTGYSEKENVEIIPEDNNEIGEETK